VFVFDEEGVEGGNRFQRERRLVGQAPKITVLRGMRNEAIRLRWKYDGAVWGFVRGMVIDNFGTPIGVVNVRLVSTIGKLSNA